MNAQDAQPQIDGVLAALADGHPEDAKLLLHPYIRWTTPSGGTVRGRDHVLRLLASLVADREHVQPPTSVELRDDQIYRWRG